MHLPSLSSLSVLSVWQGHVEPQLLLDKFPTEKWAKGFALLGGCFQLLSPMRGSLGRLPASSDLCPAPGLHFRQLSHPRQ